MGHSDFEDSKDGPAAGDKAAEDELTGSVDRKSAKKKGKSSRSQEWGGDIVANGYLMILYQ